MSCNHLYDCKRCRGVVEELEEEIERMKPELAALRLQVKMMVTIDEVEAWHTYLRNIGEIAWVERNLRSPRFGLAAHAKKEDEG